MKRVDEILKPIDQVGTQAYLDNRLQLFDIIEYILKQTGHAEVFITTFSISEEFLRKIYKFKEAGLISSSTLVTDFKALKKTLNLYRFIENTFDSVHLAENHSKVVLIMNRLYRVAIVTSQNQTRGNRTEGGIITIDNEVFNTLLNQITELINNRSTTLHELYN